jgi:hypothetical protein
MRVANPYVSERIRRIVEGVFASGGPHRDEMIGYHHCGFQHNRSTTD